MMNGHYQNKIEKSGRRSKAKCRTRLWLSAARGVLFCAAMVSVRLCAAAAVEACPPAASIHIVQGGGEGWDRGARAAGMGGAGMAVAGGAESALRNPAMLLAAAGGGVLCVTPARFEMTELASAAAVWTEALAGWNAALALQRFGHELHAEHRIGAIVAVPLAASLAAGVRISALHIGFERYGGTMLPVLDVGVRCMLGGGVQVGAAGFALNMPSIDHDERIPAGLSAGVAWRDDGLLLALDYEKDARVATNLRLGAEYRLLDRLLLRCGASTLTREWTAGFGLRHASLILDYAYALHTELGATHTIGIGFQP
ncbi:MAG: hypothetical protein KFH87_06330 [Bacteroidetes bacterium]|nr:hypothetical protein [Bacteroidota bacterium]